MMPWYHSFGLMIGMILILMALRLPVAFAFLIANAIGVMIFMGGHFGLVQMAANASESLLNYSLVPIPLFLLMGELFFHTGIAKRVFMVVDRLLGNVRGRAGLCFHRRRDVVQRLVGVQPWQCGDDGVDDVSRDEAQRLFRFFGRSARLLRPVGWPQ